MSLEVSSSSENNTSRALLTIALATVFTSSAAIMLLQLVASRLSAAYLGQSLYTWTSAIGVTLAGIAIGNAIGGRLADRAPGTRTLAVQLLLAAGGVVLVLALNPLAGALPPLIALPWPVRIFLHTTLVYLLPFSLLGTISPLIGRLALSAGGPAGSRIGSVYLWSITGSLLGVFLTGYFLFNVAGNRAILLCAAGVIALLGAALFFLGRAPTQATTTEATVSSPPPLRLIIITLLAGALVMMIELAAARMLARVYGSSLFTWTTTIGVILAALALGGRFGGRWADRFGSQRTLAATLIGASVASAVLPLLHNILFRFPLLWDLPWPVQIFLHTMLVFFLPCLLLGAVPPAAIRQALENHPAPGRILGTLYAWNSLGSILGAFLAGFVLIAALGTVQVICITFLVCAALALYAVPASTPARAWAVIALFLGLASFVPVPPFSAVGLNLALRPYRAPDTVFERESQYAYIAVNEIDPEVNPGLRTFVIDKLVHNKTDLNHPLDLKYLYLQCYAAALNLLHPLGEPLDTLHIGGGGYSFINFLEQTRPGGKTIAVEIDPVVTEAAHAAFGFPRDTKAEIHHLDGRNYVTQQAVRPDAPKFDAIFGDCLNDYTVPFHLTTLEYTRQLAGLLKDDGVYMFNMVDIGNLDAPGQFLRAVLATCREVFPNVYVFTPDGQATGRITFIVIATKRPVDFGPALAALNAYSHQPGALKEASQILADQQVALLTDDYAPVENLLAPVVLQTEESTLFRRLIRADEFMRQGHPDKAAREAEIIVARSKNFPEASELLANAYEALGDTARALATLRDLADTHPNNPDYREKLAVHLFRAGSPQEALQDWQAVLQQEPSHPQAHLDLGAALLKLNRLDEAEPHLRTALQALPQSESAHINYMALHVARGDLPTALQILKDATAKFPNSANMYAQLAIVAARAKDFPAARDAAAKAQSLGATLPPALLRDLQGQ